MNIKDIETVAAAFTRLSKETDKYFQDKLMSHMLTTNHVVRDVREIDVQFELVTPVTL